MTQIPERLKQKGIRFVLIERGSKKPFEKDWTNKNIYFDDNKLQEHLKKGGNYGVLGGRVEEGKYLIVIDFDDEKIQEELIKKLPETFTVKTGGGFLHLYFWSERGDSFKIFTEEMDTLLDVQGNGKQVIGAGSLHPNGNTYDVIKNIEISFINYSELKAIIIPYDKKPKRQEEKKEIQKERHLDDSFLDDLKMRLSIKDVLNWIGIDTSKNPTQCPFHHSEGGKCLGFKNETAHCFHCDGSWNIFSLIMEYKKCNFKESLEILAGIAGMEKELEESRKRYIEKIKTESKQEYNEIKLEFLEIIGSNEKGKWGKASEFLVEFILSKIRLYTIEDDVKDEVWVYKDGIYIPQGKCKIKEFLRNLLGDYYSSFVYNMVLAKIEIDTYIDPDKFFKTNHLNEIPVLNGILNLRTLELSEYNPEKIYFNKMPVEFNPNAKCPKIDNFLSEVLANEEDKKVFYELLGFGLLNDYKYEKAFMFHGDGRNGKGKSIEIIKRLFGIESCCSIQLSALKSDSFSISELFGKRFNLAGDIGNQDLKETNFFKSLTGRDLVSSKRKYLKDLHFQNNAKFVFACNELPMVYDLSKGFWDRWVLLNFPYTFVLQSEYDAAEDKKNLKIRDEDVILKITEPEEMSGLLNEAINGLERLKKNKGFSTTKGSEDIKSTWIRRSNSFIGFCWDNLEDDYEGRISKRDLRKKYADYCKQHKVSTKSDGIIKRVLQEQYGAIEIRGQDYFGDSYIRNDYWMGVKWK